MSRLTLKVMRTGCCWFGLLLIAFLTFAHAEDLPVPALRGRVNDYAKMLSPADISRINSKLMEFEGVTHNQIVVLTIETLAGTLIDEFAEKTFKQWKLGEKGKDNGVLVLVSKQEREIRIEVGYGLEGRLTDAKCKSIIRGTIVPYFKSGNFAEGIYSGLTEMIEVIGGMPTAKKAEKTKPGFWERLFLNLFYVALALFVLSVLLNFLFLAPLWIVIPLWSLLAIWLWVVQSVQLSKESYWIQSILTGTLLVVTPVVRAVRKRWTLAPLEWFIGLIQGVLTTGGESRASRRRREGDFDPPSSSSSSRDYSGGGGRSGGGGSSDKW